MSHRKSTPTYYYNDSYFSPSPSSTDRHVASLSQSAPEIVTSISQLEPATTNYHANRGVDWGVSFEKRDFPDHHATILPQHGEKSSLGRQPFQPSNCKQDTDSHDGGSRSPQLLCSEKFLSPTPPSDDSGWSQSNGSTVWTHSTTVGRARANPEITQVERVYGVVNNSHSTHVHNEPSANQDTQSRYSNHKPLVNWDTQSAYINHEPHVNREARNEYSKAKPCVEPDTQNNSHAVILISDKSAKPKDLLLKTALLGGVVSQGDVYTVDSSGVSLQAVTSRCVSDIQTFVSNDVESCRRMSGTNGYDRSRMTGSSQGGSNSSLSRLSDDHTSQGQSQQPPGAVPDAMLVGHLGAAGVVGIHDTGSRSIVAGTAGAGPQAALGGVFQPPHSASSDPAARYGPVYTSGTSAPTVGPFSPLYATPHGQALSPYSAFYSQYPGYSQGAVVQAHLRPQIESYSAVLQSMGSQAAQSQGSRPSFGSAPAGATLAQYPLLGTTRTNTSPSSAKGFSRPSVGGARDMRNEREEIDSKVHREQEIEMQRRYSTGFLKEEKSHHFSPPTGYPEPSRASLSSALRESPNIKRDLPSGAGDFYKVPIGREGSLKHRLLRPSETTSGSVSIGNPQHSAFTSTEEPSPKRTKPDTVDISSTFQQSHVINRESNLAGPGVSGAAMDLHKHLQYPQHFMKGSVIQLANGSLKHVEDLETDDFRHSAEVSNDLKIDSSTVVNIEENSTQGTAVLGFVVGEHKVQVTVEATLEHPFFVFGRGWSSCQPSRTIQRYGLECHKLTVGDVCISLTHKDVTDRAAEISKQQQQQQSRYSLFKPDIVSSTSVGQGSSQRSYGQVHRSVSEAGRELGGPKQDEHQFTVPPSQPANTEAQEQKSP